MQRCVGDCGVWCGDVLVIVVSGVEMCWLFRCLVRRCVGDLVSGVKMC